MPRTPSLFLPLVLLLVLPGAAAQEPPAPETFYESIDVEVVNLEVFVTDRQGNRVVGLTRNDFEILESGKRISATMSLLDLCNAQMGKCSQWFESNHAACCSKVMRQGSALRIDTAAIPRE